MRLYHELLATYGRQHWWPVHSGRKRPGFDPVFEVLAGCILTQNTSWTNVEKAIDALYAHGLLTPVAITKIRIEKLRRLIRPAGYFKQKALKLRIFSRAIMDDAKGSARRYIHTVSRDDLLALWGIGPETADSMLLYGANRPEFVIDTYTKRLCARHGIVYDAYDDYKTYFRTRLPVDAQLYNEFHALVVRWGKDHHPPRKTVSTLSI